MKLHTIAFGLCAMTFWASAARAEDGAASKANMHKVAKGAFKVEITLEGVFEPRQSKQVVLRPEVWTELTVLEAAAQGATVKAGDVLLKLDTKKLAEAIRDAENAAKIEQLSIEETQAEIRALEETTSQELAQAKREREIAVADLVYFTDTERSANVKQLEFMLKMYNNFLAYAKEELRQLEKMYKADDLMEETEEIIIKQQRDQVEAATFFLEAATRQRDRTVGTDLPREEQRLKDTVERTRVAADKAERTLPLTLGKLRVSLVKQQDEYVRGQEKLTKLKQDLAGATIVAPLAGVVYYGECRHGVWTHPELEAKLRRDGNLAGQEVLFTIVEPRPLVVYATVPEKELAGVRPELAARVTPTAFPQVKLRGTVEHVATLPDPAGKFAATIKLDDAQVPADRLAAGMSCALKLTTYQNDDAIAVPAKAVHADDRSDDGHYVYVNVADGKPSRRDVTVGQRTESRWEITAGLEPGETILLEKPESDG